MPDTPLVDRDGSSGAPSPDRAAFRIALVAATRGLREAAGPDVLAARAADAARALERAGLFAATEPARDPLARAEGGLIADLASLAETALRRVESLIAAESRAATLEAVLRALPVGVAVVDAASGRGVLANDHLAHIWRHPDPAAPSLGEPAGWQGFHRDGCPYEPGEWPQSRALAGGESVADEEIAILRKDGTKGWIAASAAPVRDPQGRIGLAVVAVRDITARWHREDEYEKIVGQLAQEKARWEATAESMIDLLVVADARGRIAYANAAYARVFGRDAGGESRAQPRRLDGTPFDPEDLPLQRAAVRGDEVRAAEMLLGSGGESDIYTVWNAAPIRDAEGRVSGAVAVGRDRTELHRAEVALRAAHDDLERKVRERTADLERANRTLRMITECNEALVQVGDERELIQAICGIIQDRGGFRMTWVGYAEADRGRTIRPVASAGLEEGYLDAAGISWADNERGRGPTGTAIREARVCVSEDFLTDPELAPWREEARRRGYRSSIALPLLEGGRAFGALSIYAAEPVAFAGEQAGLLKELADDLAFGILSLRVRVERDRATRSLEHTTAQLRALASELVLAEQRERSRVAGVLHDHLQQLLVGARYGLEGLRVSSRAKTVREKAARVDRMLEGCLEASRSLTAELSPPVLRDPDLAGALRWLVSWFDEKHGLAVELDAARCPVDAEEVRVALFQAVRELLFNVVKHAGVARARVRLSRSGDGLVRVAVSDEGAGFNPSAAVRGTAAATPGVSGFGLFGIRERLSLLGGRLEIKSGQGKGSQFTLVVPTRKAGGSRPPGTRRAATGRTRERQSEGLGPRPARARRSIRVLVADDHRVVREGLAKLLEGQADISLAGVAADGREAVDLARALRPDVVVMDIGMPLMNGIEATRLVRAALPGVRVIGLSMHTEASQVSAMLEAGADICLDKAGPFDALLASIRAG